MEYPLTKALAVVTLGYSAWVVTSADTLRTQLDDPADWQKPASRLALTYAGRDVPISTLALLGGAGAPAPRPSCASPATSPTRSRSAHDRLLGVRRKKAVAVAAGYGVLNALALVVDERRRRA